MKILTEKTYIMTVMLNLILRLIRQETERRAFQESAGMLQPPRQESLF